MLVRRDYTFQDVHNLLLMYHIKSIKQSDRAFFATVDIPRSTARHWITLNQRGALFKHHPAGRPSIITDEIKRLIRKYVLRKCDVTVTSVWRYIRRKGILCSRSTVWNIMKKHLNLSFKKKTFVVWRKKHRRDVVNSDIRKMQRKMRNIGLEHIVSIDEVPFYREMYSQRGWGIKGEKLVKRRESVRSKRYSIIAAVSCHRLVAYRMVPGSVNNRIFASFLKDDVFPQLNSPQHLLVDNASMHRTLHVRETVENGGHRLLFNLPYIPELNPIENTFSISKRCVKRRGTKTHTQLDKEFSKSMRAIKPHQLMNMFRKSAGLTKTVISR